MYVKLFSSIYQGTLRGNSHGLLVFTNLLAHADREGYVDIHPRAIAEETGVSVEEVRIALLMLEAPDSESRTNSLEGRRIVRLDEHRAWGWQIVNYAKYREIKNEEDRRQQNRESQQRFRDKHKKSTVITRNQRSAQSAHADADADADGVEKAKPRRATALSPDWTPSADLSAWATNERPDLEAGKVLDRFRDFWTAKPGKDGRKLDWDATYRNWVRNERQAPGAGTSAPVSQISQFASRRVGA